MNAETPLGQGVWTEWLRSTDEAATSARRKTDMKDKKPVSIDALALSGVVVDALQVSKGDVVDMIIGQCEDSLKEKVKALNKEAEELLTLTADEVRGMMNNKPLKLDSYSVERGRVPTQLYVGVDFPRSGPIFTRMTRAGKLLEQASAYQEALNDLVNGKSAKRAILKKFMEAHPEGRAAITQIEAFGNNLLKTLNERVALQLEA